MSTAEVSSHPQISTRGQRSYAWNSLIHSDHSRAEQATYILTHAGILKTHAACCNGSQRGGLDSNGTPFTTILPFVAQVISNKPLAPLQRIRTSFLALIRFLIRFVKQLGSPDAFKDRVGVDLLLTLRSMRSFPAHAQFVRTLPGNTNHRLNHLSLFPHLVSILPVIYAFGKKIF